MGRRVRPCPEQSRSTDDREHSMLEHNHEGPIQNSDQAFACPACSAELLRGIMRIESRLNPAQQLTNISQDEIDWQLGSV